MIYGRKLCGNCDTRICLGATDTLTAQYFSDLIGVSTIENMSVRKANGLDGEFDYGQKNISTLKRNLINPDEVLRLPNNKLIVNIRGNKPLILDKVIYTEHPLFKKLEASSINEYNPQWNKKEIKNKVTKENIKSQNKEDNKEDITFDNF